MAALANPSKRWHIVLRCTIRGPLGVLLIYRRIILLLSTPIHETILKTAHCTLHEMHSPLKWAKTALIHIPWRLIDVALIKLYDRFIFVYNLPCLKVIGQFQKESNFIFRNVFNVMCFPVYKILICGGALDCVGI